MADAPGTGPLSGDALRGRIEKADTDVRTVAAVRSRDKIPRNPAGKGAQRYLGKSLAALAPRVRALFADTYATGIYKGLPFDVAGLDQAIARAADTRSADTRLRTLGQDVHAEN